MGARTCVSGEKPLTYEDRRMQNGLEDYLRASVRRRKKHLIPDRIGLCVRRKHKRFLHILCLLLPLNFLCLLLLLSLAKLRAGTLVITYYTYVRTYDLEL